MKAPKIKFTNVITFEGTDMNGINADVYINGIKCIKMIDDGSGGELILRNYAYYPKVSTEKINKQIDILDEYIKTLPAKKFSTFELPMTMEMFLDDQLIEQEVNKAKQKAKQKFEKVQRKSICFGVPGEPKYRMLTFKMELKNVPLGTLQNHIDGVKKNYCKDGVQILNTNLEGFDITV